MDRTLHQSYDPARIINSVVWLEEEQRGNREMFNRLTQQMERFQAFLDEQADYLRSVDESQTAIRQQLARIPMVEDTTNATRDQLARVEVIVAELEKATVQFQRIVENEVENIRNVHVEHQHQLQALRSSIEGAEIKLRSIEEGERRRMDTIAALDQRVQDLVKIAESADTRSRSVNEQIKRTHDEVEQMSAHLATLVDQDEAIASRVQVIAEQIKGVDDKADRTAIEMEQFRPLGERIDVIRAEHQRVAYDVGGLIQNYAHLNEKVEDIGRQVRDSNSRTRESFDKMMTLRQEVWEFAQATQEYVMQLLRIEERQKRREITELEQQIKEFRGHKGSLGNLSSDRPIVD